MISLRTFREHVGALLLFAALGLVGMWPQAPPTAWATALHSPDIDGTYLAVVMWWTRHALLAEPAHVLDAPFFHPAPHAVAASDHVLSLSAASLPFAWLCPNAMFAYRLTTLIMVAVSGWGMWWFVARATGDRWAGLVAGVVWALGPHTFHSLNRAHIMPSPFWAPLAAMLLADLLDPHRRRLLAAIALLVAATYVGWYATLFALFFMACWCAAVPLAARALASRGWLLRMAALGAATAAALVPVLLAYRGGLETVYLYSDLLLRNRTMPWQIAIPGNLSPTGRAIRAVVGEAWNFPDAYMGLVPWLAIGGAAAALAHRRTRAVVATALSRPSVRVAAVFAAILVVVGLAFAAGPRIHVHGHDIELPLAWMGRLCEPLKFSRWSSRFGLLTAFGLATLAGVALHALRAALPTLLGGARGRAIMVAVALVAFADAIPVMGKSSAPLRATPLLDRLAERNDIAAIAEAPVRDMTDTVEAMMHMTRHGHPIPHGYSDIGFGPTNVEDFLNLWPAPAARAAMEFADVEALLLVPERFDGDAPTITADWREFDRDDRFVLVAPDGDMPGEAAALLADLEDIPEPSPAISLDGPEFIALAWRDGLQLDGCRFVAGPDAMTAVDFDPPIDARRHRRVVVRMRLFSGPASPEATQIFWTSPSMPHASERRTTRQPVPVDGEWHDIVFDFSRDPRWVWCGEISQIRWDPTHSSNYRGEIGGMRIE